MNNKDDENKKIDWNEKFKEFVANYVDDNKKRSLILNFFSLARREMIIKPEDFSQIYNDIYNKKGE